jgi:hypothetical protein
MSNVAELSETEAGEIREFVVRNQFVVRSAGTFDGFGDEQQVWERDGALVRLTHDRGEWWCDLSHFGWSDWFDVDLAAGAFGSKSYGRTDRVGDVIDKFTDDRMLEPLRAYRADVTVAERQREDPRSE